MTEPTKIKLIKIAQENWKYTLYKSEDNRLFGSFVYSPQSYIDVSMLIELNSQEITEYNADVEAISRLSEKIRNNHLNYQQRALDSNNFYFIK